MVTVVSKGLSNGLVKSCRFYLLDVIFGGNDSRNFKSVIETLLKAAIPLTPGIH